MIRTFILPTALALTIFILTVSYYESIETNMNQQKLTNTTINHTKNISLENKQIPGLDNQSLSKNHGHEHHTHSGHSRHSGINTHSHKKPLVRKRKTPIDNLDLSSEQIAKYQSQLSFYTKQRKALVTKRNRISPKEYRDQLYQINLAYQNNLFSFMTQVQILQYKENIAEYKRRNKIIKPQRQHHVQQRRDNHIKPTKQTSD
ncbi:hypothetical protein KO527_13840 [Pseudoalteromonas sp. C2R02]|uniref:hypothetical protein n=1 Tax=Pseudoalteromonas sp. C2R02 TaxID=2841565 RepID=UPI001C0956DE|nr:hypothetical protein [Pseudoalteromonas sp. C2R02]MBU2970430.1 hypothetical protein [Pseudoalteromonas sp. C2R02]